MIKNADMNELLSLINQLKESVIGKPTHHDATYRSSSIPTKQNKSSDKGIFEQIFGKLYPKFDPSEAINEATSSKHKETVKSTGYRAPIHGTFYNSGDFFPGININDRHKGGHDGVDLRAPGGTPVYPIKEGTITRVADDPKGGNNVNVSHPDNVRSYYAHLGTISVSVGDKVDQNTILGTVGDSGNAKGTMPHCHFQVWENNIVQDPKKYFSIPPYSDMGKGEKKWLSSEYENAARSFNIKDVKRANRTHLLLKVASLYHKVASS